MHYYQHHIGDFIRDTARLSDSQCMAYLRMIWLYYETEKPLPDNLKVLALKVGGSEDDIGLLLEAFFQKQDGAWVHARCEREIEAYNRMSQGGRQGAAKRWSKGSDAPPIAPLSGGQCPPNANQEPITNNQEPLEKHKPISQLALLKSKNIPEPLARDWLAIRKAKKSPLTESTLAGTEREALKAGISLEDAIRIACENTWAGFKAEYLNKPKARASPTYQDPRADVMRAIWSGGKRERDITGEVDGKVIPAVFERIR